MADSIFNRDTLLDISVNIVPLVIIAFFAVFLLFYSPYPPELFIEIVAIGLHVVPFVLLALLTYVAAKIIE